MCSQVSKFNEIQDVPHICNKATKDLKKFHLEMDFVAAKTAIWQNLQPASIPCSSMLDCAMLQDRVHPHLWVAYLSVPQ